MPSLTHTEYKSLTHRIQITHINIEHQRCPDPLLPRWLMRTELTTVHKQMHTKGCFVTGFRHLTYPNSPDLQAPWSHGFSLWLLALKPLTILSYYSCFTFACAYTQAQNRECTHTEDTYIKDLFSVG